MNEIYRLRSHEMFNNPVFRAGKPMGRQAPTETGQTEFDTNVVTNVGEPVSADEALLRTDGGDSVEFSGSALAISREQAIESAASRADRLMRIRAMIENNTYETPEKIRATASRLVEVLEL